MRNTGKIHLWLIRVIGILVPQRLRADWRQEWEAELRYRELLLAEWDKLDGTHKLDLLRRSVGAFWDALLLQPQRLEDEMLQDFRYGVRMLRKQPGFTLLAIFTLSLGIGANSAIFSVVNAVLLRPLPYPEPERLAILRQDVPKLDWSSFAVTPAEALDYRTANDVFSDIAAYKTLGLNLTGRGEAQRIQAARVSASLFKLLGVSPLQGRTFAPEEDQPGRERVAVLSHRLWQAQFGADPAIIGQVVKLDEQAYTVVGVMPPRVQFPHAGTAFVEATELWIPLVFSEQELAQRRAGQNVGLIGRLKPGVSFAQAQASVEAITARFQQQHANEYQNIQVVTTVHSLAEQVTSRVRPTLFVLLGAVGAVLLIACANVAHLWLARGVTRRKELAVRRALGASSARLLRQMLTESTLLGLLGGTGGLLLAAGLIKILVKLGPEDVPRLQEIALDEQMLGFTLLLSLLTGVLCGLTPALQSVRFNLNETLKESGRSGGREGKRFRGVLVVFETAAALVLLVGAGLLLNSFVRLLRVPPGFDSQGVLMARTTLPAARYPQPEQTHAVHQQILDRLAALPGVQAVAAANYLPLTGYGLMAFRVEGDNTDQTRSTSFALVSPDYFRAMGIQLRAGRFFTAQDRQNTPGVVVIDETLARRCWPGANLEAVLGKRLARGRSGTDWLTVVGVVADVKVSSLDEENPPMIYTPLQQATRVGPNLLYLARTAIDPASFAGLLRREFSAVDRDLPVYDIQPLRQVLGDSVAQRRFAMLLLTLLAGVALALAASGLFGVMSYTVTQQTHEIGVRLALGAQARDVLKLVVGQGMKLTLGGVVLGLGGAWALTRLMKGLLFGLSATDPMTFVAVALLLVGVALVACYLPARRAAKVDPLVALRHD